MKNNKYMMKAKAEVVATMTNNPEKLSNPKLLELEGSGAFESGELYDWGNHAFSIFIIFSPSVTFRIARETSVTKGEPIGNT